VNAYQIEREGMTTIEFVFKNTFLFYGNGNRKLLALPPTLWEKFCQIEMRQSNSNLF